MGIRPIVRNTVVAARYMGGTRRGVPVRRNLLAKSGEIMSRVGQKEIQTQKHIIQLFKDELDYDYLGDWKDREGNSNVEEGLPPD